MHQKKSLFQFLHFHMIIYTPFERSWRVLTLFVVFDFDQTCICRKIKKTWKTKKVSRPFPKHSVFWKIQAEYSGSPSLSNTQIIQNFSIAI